MLTRYELGHTAMETIYHFASLRSFVPQHDRDEYYAIRPENDDRNLVHIEIAVQLPDTYAWVYKTIQDISQQIDSDEDDSTK